MPSPEKILVLSLTRMGDMIQSIPFFRRLRLRHPDAEIQVLVERCFGDVVRMVTGVDTIHEVRLEDLLPNLQNGSRGSIAGATAYYRDLIENLRKNHYVEVWNLTHTRPSMVMNFLLAAERGQGVTLDCRGLQRVNSPWLAYFFATNLARPWCQFNLVDIYANCVRGIPWEAGRSLCINVSDSDPLPPSTTGRTRVAIHPGASQPDKRWPAESFRELASRLALLPSTDVVIVAGQRDVKLARIFEGIDGVINLAGKTTPRDLAVLFKGCRLLISNDSGPMHVAAAVGTPVLDLTVGSALASETAPYGTGHVAVEPDVECFPCSPRRPCTSGTCGNRITPETVLGIAEWMLGWREQPRAHELTGCRVYRTAFSKSDGLLTLQRIGADGPSERDEINERVRPFWLSLLENRTDWPRQSFPVEDMSLLRRAVVARRASRSAARLAHQLAGAARNNRFTPTLQNLGELLLNQERKVLESLQGENILDSFLAYLRIQRGSLSGDTVAEQARETASLYRKLSRLLDALAPAFLLGKNDNKIPTDLIEDAHEDHAQWT